MNSTGSWGLERVKSWFGQWRLKLCNEFWCGRLLGHYEVWPNQNLEMGSRYLQQVFSITQPSTATVIDLLRHHVTIIFSRVRFNPIEKDLLCSTVSDRSIVLYDVRAPTPMKKVTLNMQSNGISWNPQEAMIFTVANEDNNLYSFDLRNVSLD